MHHSHAFELLDLPDQLKFATNARARRHLLRGPVGRRSKALLQRSFFFGAKVSSSYALEFSYQVSLYLTTCRRCLLRASSCSNCLQAFADDLITSLPSCWRTIPLMLKPAASSFASPPS